MLEAELHPYEQERLDFIESVGLDQIKSGRGYQPAIELLSSLVEQPICLFTVVYREEQLFHALKGLSVDRTPRSMAFCAHAIVGDEPVLEVFNARRDERFVDNPLVTGQPKIQGYTGRVVHAPNGLPIGTVCIIDRVPFKLNSEQFQHLENTAQLIENIVKLESQARTDTLTELANRRMYEQRLHEEWLRAKRSAGRVGVLVVDVDDFSAINNSFGHDVGDKYLRVIASAIRGCLLRASDLAARYGGEEFVCIVPGADEESLEKLAEKIRLAVTAAKPPVDYGCCVTLCIGSALLSDMPNDAASTDEVFRRADEALLNAKRRGKNRHVAWHAKPS